MEKTKYLIINNRHKPNDLALKVGDSEIQRTPVHKFLGVNVDGNLTFDDHIDKMC